MSGLRTRKITGLSNIGLTPALFQIFRAIGKAALYLGRGELALLLLGFSSVKSMQTGSGSISHSS
jgi:hypothetical protein